jgi:hypothetical protein
MARNLVILGLALVAIGFAWPWLEKIGLFRLPGDIVIERENSRFYFPVTSMLLLSLLISFIVWLIKK